MDRIHELVLRNEEKIIEYRRHIHQNPDLSNEEKETAAYVADALRQIGLEPKTGVGVNGVTAIIEGKGEGKCIALRADMDALPILEQTGFPFASVKEGKSHACGHDCHTAMLLGAARVLHELRDSFPGKVKLIFQPAEENPYNSGAQAMLRDNVLEGPKVDMIIGQHVYPGAVTGSVNTRKGALSASSDRFKLTIKGRNAHGSEPENGIDAITVAAEVISGLQQIVSRQISPLKNCVVTIGRIVGGERSNVIAGEVYMEGTCRCTDMSIRESLPGRMEKIIRGITEAFGAEYVFDYLMGYPPVVNDDASVDFLEKMIGEIPESRFILREQPLMGGEDFAYYLKEVPGCIYFIGCTPEDHTGPVYPLHNGKMNVDENVLRIGTEIFATAAYRFLNE